jgi:hypothetical protein
VVRGQAARRQRLEASGRVEQQSGTVAAAPLHYRNLPAQVLHLGDAQRVRRPGFDGDQQSECRVQCAGVALGPGRREQALCPATWVGC